MAKRQADDSPEGASRPGSGPSATDHEQGRTTGQAAAPSGKEGRQPPQFVEDRDRVLDGHEADSRDVPTQAAGSREEAAEAARQAAADAGREVSELFAGSPGEEGPAPNIPSSLDLDRQASAARTGRAELQQKLREHNETSPAVTGGDIDADWGSAYSVGDEAPGGDNPTPDQQSVEEVAGALGVEYEDTEELKGVEKIEARDRRRWELDPASSEDYNERSADITSKRRKNPGTEKE